MKAPRPRFRDRDAESRRAAQAAAARKKRLPLPPSASAASPGDAPDPDPAAAQPVDMTDEAALSLIQRGSRHYNPPTLQQPPQPWLDQADTNTTLLLKDLAEQGPSTATGGESTPRISWPDTSATFAGEGEFNADASVVRPEPNSGPITHGSLSRIETDYANLLALAISLGKLARDEIDRLAGECPNDPYTIEDNKKQRDLLSILADGFAKLAAALMEYSESPKPLLAGKAKRIADDLSVQFEVWWTKNRGEAIDWAVRIPTLTASIAALGWTGANMTFGTVALSALIGGPKVIAAIKAATKRKRRP